MTDRVWASAGGGTHVRVAHKPDHGPHHRLAVCLLPATTGAPFRLLFQRSSQPDAARGRTRDPHVWDAQPAIDHTLAGKSWSGTAHIGSDRRQRLLACGPTTR